MKYLAIRENPDFVGRNRYWRQLEAIEALDEAAIIVIYGRRRVGKPELIEQFFRQRSVLKFEGLQPDRSVIRKSDPTEVRRQIAASLARLDEYTESGNHYRRMKLEHWSEFFEILLPYVKSEPVVLYFEELQWLA